MIILEMIFLLFYAEACLYSNSYSVVLVTRMIEVYAIIAFVLGMFGTYTVLDIISKRKGKAHITMVRSK
ncbi:hypothetical protein HRbin04_00935 [archaeon HR04]|nr:hypothetical protein HRbin04_00935 [archaeon HR04]